jgi:6-phosphogluconolactonase/glucosamine-6-phosphate isomerase/deaminase
MTERPPKRIGNLRLFVRETRTDALLLFAQDFTKKLRELRAEKRDVLFLSSGGSALGVLDHVDPDMIAPYLTIGIFDERYDPTNKSSNYAQLRKTEFYRKAVERGCRLIDTSTHPKQTQEELASFYEEELRSWRRSHPDGVILATMGVAANGHTAGIMPFPEDPVRFHELFEGERWIVAYDAGDKNEFPLRVTTTFTFLRMVDTVGIFLVGAAKGETFRAILSGDDLPSCPGRIIKELHGGLYVDKAMLVSAGFTI